MTLKDVFKLYALTSIALGGGWQRGEGGQRERNSPMSSEASDHQLIISGLNSYIDLLYLTLSLIIDISSQGVVQTLESNPT